MAWNLEVKTKDKDHHVVKFDSKEEAEAALAELSPRIGRSGNVEIGGQLVIVAAHVVSAQVYEDAGPLIA